MKTLPTKNLKTLNEVLIHITEDSFYKGYSASFFNKGDFRAEELFSDYIMLVIGMKLSRVIELCSLNEFKYYSVAMIRNIVFNKNSSFNKNFNNSSLVHIDDLSNEDSNSVEVSLTRFNYFDQNEAEHLLNSIESYLGDLGKIDGAFYYDEQVFNLYYNKYNSFRKMAKATNIPPSSLYHSIAKSKKRIKEIFETDYQKISDNGGN